MRAPATMAEAARDALDRRYMAAAIRLSRRHRGLTGTNPSVATLLVSSSDGAARVVGSGVTAVGGRPHAEPQALAEAGEAAHGATAYVTLEPCAHHGRTPPCAQALIDAGVARVVGGASDPDPRVSGRGYAMLRAAGMEVTEGVLADECADELSGYLSRSLRKRPEVLLKLAVSADGMIGLEGKGQVAITGEVARAQVHLMRAQADAILIGVGTAIADDPLLTCRLPGLESRSPARIVLDPRGRLPLESRLVGSAYETPLLVATETTDEMRRNKLARAGAQFMAVETVEGRIALPELLEDLAATGTMSLMVEGGAATAMAFLDEGLVDRLALFVGPDAVGGNGIAAPVTAESVPAGFLLRRQARFGDDLYFEYAREG